MAKFNINRLFCQHIFKTNLERPNRGKSSTSLRWLIHLKQIIHLRQTIHPQYKIWLLF